MIWFLIWYIFMGVAGSDLLAGIIIGLNLLIRGYHVDFDQIVEYTMELGEKRRDEGVLIRLAEKYDGMGFVWVAFQFITWPVDFLRIIFLDYHDAFEWYESQRVN